MPRFHSARLVLDNGRTFELRDLSVNVGSLELDIVMGMGGPIGPTWTRLVIEADAVSSSDPLSDQELRHAVVREIRGAGFAGIAAPLDTATGQALDRIAAQVGVSREPALKAPLTPAAKPELPVKEALKPRRAIERLLDDNYSIC